VLFRSADTDTDRQTRIHIESNLDPWLFPKQFKRHLSECEIIDVMTYNIQQRALANLDRKNEDKAANMRTANVGKHHHLNTPYTYKTKSKYILCYECKDPIWIGQIYYSKRNHTGAKYFHFDCALRLNRI